MSTSVGVDRKDGGRLAAVCMQAARRPEELGCLLGSDAVPVVDRERARPFRQPVRHVRTGVGQRIRVVVVAVEQHDPAEADGGQAGDHVLDEGHERRDPDVDEPGEPDVRVRQAVVDRRGDDRADVRGDAPCDLGRDERIGEQRTVRAVLLGRADRHDHGVVIGEETLHLGARHLAEEHGRRLHQAPPWFRLTRATDRRTGSGRGCRRSRCSHRDPRTGRPHSRVRGSPR